MNAFDWPLAPPRIRSVATQELGRSFGRLEALYRVGIRAEAGAITAVLGPNGAGKTTLLQLLATLDRPSEGAVRFDDLDAVRDRDTVRPHLGLVAHDSLLYGDLTGAENLEFVADLYGVSRDRVSLWLERVGLAEAADRPASTYSRGMKQRLSIARALLPEPSVLLFDEPLTGLDRSARSFLWSLLRWLRARERVVIVVTHHLAWPADAVDRAVVLERGRVRFDGAVEGGALAEVYDRVVRA